MCRLIFRTVKMHDVHQRMSGLETEKAVVLLDSVCFYYFHNPLYFSCDKYNPFSNKKKRLSARNRNRGTFIRNTDS